MQEMAFLRIMRAPHTGNGVTAAIIEFGNDAGQKIDFIAFRHGNKHIRMLKIGLPQDVET